MGYVKLRTPQIEQLERLLRIHVNNMSPGELRLMVDRLLRCNRMDTLDDIDLACQYVAMARGAQPEPNK